jgi:hypothetical protein
MDSMEPHGQMAVDNAEQRIKRAELALQRAEEMIAVNVALLSKLRRQDNGVLLRQRTAW